MLSSRHTTWHARLGRLGPVVALALSLTALSGCSRHAEPVAPQAGAGAGAPPRGMYGNGETPSSRVDTSPQPAPKRSAKAPAKATRIVWEKSFEAALAKAKASGKPLMIDFYAVWCGPCKMLDEETYTAPEVIAESANFVNVKVDAEKRPDLERRYELPGYPTIILANSDGEPIEVLTGFAAADQFVKFMRSGLSKHMTAVIT